MPQINNISQLRSWLSGCPAIPKNAAISIDYMDGSAAEYAIYSVPSSIRYHENVLGEYVHFRENAAAADEWFLSCPMLMFVANGPASCESLEFKSGFSWVKAHQQTAERAGGKCYVLPGGHYLHWMFPDEMARRIREEF